MEKRKHERLDIEIPVSCAILDGNKKNKISDEILSKMKNLSRGGVHLTWPKAWNCKVCSNCLAWVFNHECALKKRLPLKEYNRYLNTSTLIKIKLEPPMVTESVKLVTKIAWVNPDSQDEEYEIGLSFSPEELKKLENFKKELLN